MKTEELLAILEKTGALLKGHFELRSKLHSDQYFQCANLLRYPDIAAGLCAELGARVKDALGAGRVADAVIAPALGGILVGHELARALGTPSIFAEKEDGRLALRRFTIRRGETFVVAEDVVTRGGRVQETIDIVTGRGGRVVAVAVLVDRSGGKASFACPMISLLRMEPVTWEPAQCPQCRRGVPFAHPGS
jgi:orotate phosphoribosyltransferase